MDVSFFPEERPAAGVSSAKIELHSSMQLFDKVSPDDVFAEVLKAYFSK